MSKLTELVRLALDSIEAEGRGEITTNELAVILKEINQIVSNLNITTH